MPGVTPMPLGATPSSAASKPYSTSTELKRLGLAGTVEFKPTDYWTSTVDGFYSNFKDNQIKRGIEIPLYWGGAPLQPGFTVRDSVVTSGTFDDVGASSATSPNRGTQSSIRSAGTTVTTATNGWHGFLDISYSKPSATKWCSKPMPAPVTTSPDPATILALK